MPPQGSRVVLCCLKAERLFCGATERQGFCAATGQHGSFFLCVCCHWAARLVELPQSCVLLWCLANEQMPVSTVQFFFPREVCLCTSI